MNILCQVFCALIATMFTVFILNFYLFRAINSIGRTFGRAGADILFCALLVLSAAFYIIIAIVSSLYISSSMATVIISTISFALTVPSYFLMQRFTGTMDKALIVHRNPMVLPFLVFLTFVLAAISGGVYLAWYYFLFLVLLWFVMGFICAEIAIRVYMKRSAAFGSECGRELAVFTIRCNAKGDQSILENNRRYPFP